MALLLGPGDRMPWDAAEIEGPIVDLRSLRKSGKRKVSSSAARQGKVYHLSAEG